MPATNEPVDDLHTQDRADLERLLQRFEDDWQRHPRPDLADYLPRVPGQRLATLIELVHIDIEYRLKAGEPARAEHYFQRFPELAGDRRQALALIVREFELRRNREPELSTAEYEKRFPHFRQDLAALLRLAPPVNAPAPTPTAAIDSVATLVDALDGPQLLERRQREELPALTRQFKQPKDLAREMVKRGWLTPFQINQLFQGRARDLVLGPYVLLERLGEGGMGTVYKARHRLMGRLVAVKVIRPEHLREPSAIRRFQREIRAAAQLHHPNIVLAHDAAQIGNTFLLVMEHIEGTDLARLLAQKGPLPIGQACDCVRQAALGLQHAHEQGMVHRDIKPSNLLLQKAKAGQTALGMSVKILDLGLARLHAVNDETAGDLTKEGTVMGTPDYIAPEQAQESHSVDIRADIYSLGCTLYHLLTGQVPFPGGTLAQKLVKHIMHEPAPVESLRANLPQGLPEVVRRLMAKKPAERYPTPAETATALLPYCGQAAPMAVLVTTVASAAPAAVAIHSLPTAALPAPVAVLTSDDAPTCAPIAVPLSGGETIPPEAAASLETVAALPRPVGSRHRRRWLLAGVGVVLLAGIIAVTVRPGRKPATPTEPALALEPLDRLDPKQIPPEDRFAGQPPELVSVLGQHRPYFGPDIAGRRNVLAISADGKHGAVFTLNRTTILFDPETLRTRFRIDGTGDGFTGILAFSGDGTRLAIAIESQLIAVYDPATGTEKRRCDPAPSGVSALALSPNGKRLLSGHVDGSLILWDATTGKEENRFEKQKGPIRNIVFSPDGRQAFSSADGEPKGPGNSHLRMWDVGSGKLERKFDPTGELKCNILLSRDGRRLFCWSGDTLRAWDVSDSSKGGTNVYADNANVAAVQMALSPDGRFIWWVSRYTPEGTKLLEVATGRTLRTFGSGVGAFLPDGRRVISLSRNTVTQVDVTSGDELKPMLGHAGAVASLSFSRDGRYLLSGGEGGMALWDLATRQPRWVSQVPASLARVALSPDGKHALSWHPSGHPDAGPICLWELETGRELRRVETGHGLGGFSPDGRYQLYVGTGRVLTVRGTEKGVDLEAFKRPIAVGAGLGFLPSGNQFYCLQDNTLRVWEVPSARELRAIPLVGAGSIQFSADGNRLFTAQGDATVKRWDLTGKEPRSQVFDRLNTNQVSSLSLSPDGTRLVSGDPDRRIVLWNATSDAGTPFREWFQPSTFKQLLFAPDSRHLAIANTDGTIYILRLAPPPSR